ncbi:uncharacterized protein C6orf132 homolog [Cuculus canorus]|uniref:uncharacterized protein C6orf132 homolog n=1 Tax=Cuculus canorus TaxID=55661 RepID=UPI0023AB2F64|nr:uncharacterized protein C6orf132 homolog [Cuculus canorus]
MKKHHSVQGTFSRLFGKRHASPTASSSSSSSSSLFATNPPWIFSQEVSSDSAGGTGEVIEVYYGDNRFGTTTDSGTATLKPRPRVRPLLTFLPLNAQESHGVPVPTPSVPEGFEEKAALGSGSQINGNHRMYSSVGDLRPQALEENDLDEDIPPPPSVPPPPPPTTPAPAPPPPASPAPPPPEMLPPPPPPPEVVPPPPEMVPPPPAVAPPPPPGSALSSPSTPAPPDFIPPAPPGALQPSRTLAPFTTGISKWKSETMLNTRQADAEGPLCPAETVPADPSPKESVQPKQCPEPHLTFPRSFKVPPPAPARSSSIPVQESQPSRQEPFARQPHARPPLPPCFTIRPAAKAYAGGEAEQRNSVLRQTTAKPAVPTPPPLSPKPGPGLGQGTNPAGRRSPLPASEPEKVPPPKPAERDSPPTSESFSANDLDLPPPDYPMCEDDWKDASNLNKLRDELSALLRSPRRDERPTEKPAAPRPVSGTAEHTISHEPRLNGPQLARPAGKDAQSLTGGKSEKKEVPSGAPSAKGGSPSTALPAPDSNATTQTRSVMEIRNELEAVLSLKKEGKPAPVLSGQKQGTKDGSSTPRVRKSPPDVRKSPPDARKSPPDPDDSVMPKPAPSPLPAPVAAAEKDEAGHEDHPAPATSKATETSTPAPESPESNMSPPDPPQEPAEKPPAPTCPSPPVSPAQSPAPQPDASIFQYKVHRAGASLAEPPCPTSSAEPPCPTSTTEPPCPTSSARSPLSPSGAGQDEVLIHPVTGELVERGSPMALLLAARQRAQRGRQGGEVGAVPRAKLPLKFGSASSDTTSTSFYRHESKPYSFIVVPRPPGVGTAGPGWSKPPSFSSSSEQGRDARAAGVAQSSSIPGDRRAAASSLVQGLLDLGQPTRLGTSRHGMEDEEENGEMVLDFGIIPPPPEFSNEVEEAEGSFPSREENRKCPSFPDYSRNSEPPRYFRWPGYGRGYGYGGNHEPPALLPSEKSRRNSDFTPQYPDYSSSAGYVGHGPTPRPLIKKRLYVSEPDSSYPRAAPAPRATGTLSYGTGEGVRRLSSAHRNGPVSAQGRRTSLDATGKAMTYSSTGAEAKYKGQNGDFSSAGVVSASRPAHGTSQYSGPTNTFTVRPGARQPISYVYQSGHR